MDELRGDTYFLQDRPYTRKLAAYLKLGLATLREAHNLDLHLDERDRAEGWTRAELSIHICDDRNFEFELLRVKIKREGDLLLVDLKVDGSETSFGDRTLAAHESDPIRMVLQEANAACCLKPAIERNAVAPL